MNRLAASHELVPKSIPELPIHESLAYDGELPEEVKHKFGRGALIYHHSALEKGIVAPSHPALSRESLNIPEDEIRSASTKEVVERLLNTANIEREKGTAGRVLVGLAAPQIGEAVKVISYSPNFMPAEKIEESKTGKLEVLINASYEILDDSDIQISAESCFSSGPYSARVLRANRILVRGYKVVDITESGLEVEPVEFMATGQDARILQHEIDHPDGIRATDRAFTQTPHNDKEGYVFYIPSEYRSQRNQSVKGRRANEFEWLYPSRMSDGSVKLVDGRVDKAEWDALRSGAHDLSRYSFTDKHYTHETSLAT